MALDGTAERADEPVAGGLSLGAYIAVYAAVGEGFPLEIVLAHEGIDPEAWRVADAAWAERMIASAEGDLALVDQYDRQLIEVQARFSRRVAPLDDDLAAWMDFCRIWAEAPEPLARLAELQLKRNDVLRIHRRWSLRLEADGALRELAAGILQRSPGQIPVLNIEPAKLLPPWAGQAVASAPVKEAIDVVSVLPSLSVDLPTTGGVIPPGSVALPSLQKAGSHPGAPFPADFLSLVGSTAAGASTPVSLSAPPLSHPAATPPRPFTPVFAAPPEPAEQPASSLGSTMAAMPFIQTKSPALPFHPSPSSMAEASSGTVEIKAVVAPSRTRSPARDPLNETMVASAGHVAMSPLPFLGAGAVTPPVRPGVDTTVIKTPKAPPVPPERPAISVIPGVSPRGAGPTSHPSVPSGGRVSEPPALTLNQYASLCAELSVFPPHAEAIFARHGLKELTHRRTIDWLWKERLRSDPVQNQRWQALYKHYHAAWVTEAQRRGGR